MERIQYWVRNFFGATQKEANGFILLKLVIILMLLAIPFSRCYQPGNLQSTAEDQARLDSLVAQLEASIAQQSQRKAFEHTATPSELFPFDPNLIGEEEWSKLGLPKGITRNILKYREKGGIFKIKSDLLNIYYFPEDLYEKLVPYIQLPDVLPDNRMAFTQKSERTLRNKEEEAPKEKEVTPKKTLPLIQPFAINQADTAQLKQIRGIGSVLAGRIVKFRDLLGGFYANSQLEEVYGLQPEVVTELLKYATVDSLSIKKLYLNQLEESDLANHPYISKKLAKVLVNYRKQHGAYKEAADLRNIKILDEETYQKILPYLHFGPNP